MHVPRSTIKVEPEYIEYIRYADDFLIGIDGSKEFAMDISEQTITFLNKELKLSINENKSKVIHVSEGIDYLGHRIERRVHLKKDKKGHMKRYKYPYLKIDKLKYRDRLMNLGFCNGAGEPIPCFKYLRLPQSETNRKINNTLRGLQV